MSKAVVLLSSGLDSTVNLYAAVQFNQVVRVLTFNYGQRAAEREILQSQKICAQLELPHQVIELPWFKEITQTSLVNRREDIPQGEQVKIDDYLQSLQTAKSVWVPNRNGVFLNIAASIAEGLGADFVVPGFNKEEAMTFPDNSAGYIHALDQSFSFSTANKIKVRCYTADKTKKDIVTQGRELRVPFDLMWPCYYNGKEICRRCESCQRFLRATKE